MNQEEFKASILRQFKQENAPIRRFMRTNYAWDISPTGQYAYIIGKQFFASEFKLIINVDLVDDKNETPVFQIKFTPFPEGYQVDDDHRSDDMSDESFTNVKFEEEFIKRTGTTIEFKKRFCKIGARDYQFDIQTEAVNHLLTFDIATGRFVQDTTVDIVLDHLLREYYLATAKGIYSPLLYTKQVETMLEDAMSLAHISAGLKTEYRVLFKASVHGADDTTIMRILKGLKRMRNLY